MSRPTTTASAGASASEQGVPAARSGTEVHAHRWTWQHADRDAPAVSELDLHIRPGEKVLLAGPSGAGKSTLLHGLAGVLHGEDATSSGRLLLNGLSPEEARGLAGLVQQDPESQVVLSRLGDDVAFAAENLAVPREEIWRRVKRCAAAVGLDEYPLERPTAALSGGQKQRLALAGILAMEPGLLLLDEPTANLDPQGVEQIRDAVISAADATGATLVVVEHRLGVWAEHVDTLIVLQPGGGVSRRVPASAVGEDEQLRAELAAMGLWVPGIDPLQQAADVAGAVGDRWLSARSAARIADAADQVDSPRGVDVLHGADSLHRADLLRGEQLAVSRVSPRKSWRRAAAPAPVLSGVDITVRAGEAVGITGRNGAGKSTLLLTLAGLLARHGGTLCASDQLRGEAASSDPHQWSAGELIARIGMVFQEPEHQFVTSTVAQELALSARQAVRPGSGEPLFTPEQVEQRVADLLRRLNLEQLSQANPFTLSGGEKRRLSVGTALAAGPSLLLLDEPTFGQDARTFAELIALLREHLDSGGSLCAVTHDEAFLRALNATEHDVGSLSGSGCGADSGAPSSRPAGAQESGEEATGALRAPEAPAVQAQPSAAGEDGGLPMLRGAKDQSWLGRRNALAKLIALVLVTCALVMTIDWVSSAVVILASFLLLPAAGIRISTFLGRIWPFAVGAVVAVWGTAIAGDESGRVLLDLGFTTVSEGSLALGAALGTRAFAIVLPSVIVFSTTDPTDLADSLAQQLRLPSRFVLGALAAMRLLGLLAQHWTTLGHARRARGLGARGGAGGRLRTTLSQAFGLLVQAIRMATRLAVTMESRGFGAGPRTWARPAGFTAADAPVILVGAFIAAAAVGAAMAAGAWNFVWT